MRWRRMSAFSFHKHEDSTESSPPPLPEPTRDLANGAIGGITGSSSVPGGLPPYSQRSRTSSHASHTTHIDVHAGSRSQSQIQTGPSSRRSHVDLLDAHSIITHSREHSLAGGGGGKRILGHQGQGKAWGSRDYGEDVADRNIAQHGAHDAQDGRGDMTERAFQRPDLAVAGDDDDDDGSPSPDLGAVADDPYDDTTITTQTPLEPLPLSYPFPRPSPSQSRPATVFPPPRLDSRWNHRNRLHDDASTATSNNGSTPSTSSSLPVSDATSTATRQISPLVNSTGSTSQEPPSTSTSTYPYPSSSSSSISIPYRDPRRHSVASLLRLSSLGGPTYRLKEPPPVPPPSTVPRDTNTPVHSRQTSNTTALPSSTVPQAPLSHDRQLSNTFTARDPSKSNRRPKSSSQESSSVGPISKHAKSGRPSYSAFPGTSQTEEQKDMKDSELAQRLKQTPGLSDVVDLTDTVDTDVTTTTLPGTSPHPSHCLDPFVPPHLSHPSFPDNWPLSNGRSC